MTNRRIHYQIIAFLCAVAQVAWAEEFEQTAGEVTAYSTGTSAIDYIPVYGNWTEAYQKCEFIIPATEISGMKGYTIRQMTFYMKDKAGAAWPCTFQVFLKEVGSTTTLSTFSGTSGATVVYEGGLDGTGETMTVVFDQDYTYKGENLLVGIYETEKGNDFWPASFYCAEVTTGASVYGINTGSFESITATQDEHVPKTTFTYEDGTYPKPNGLTATLTLGQYSIADLSWTQANGTPTGWVVEYATSSDFTGAKTMNVNTTSTRLTGLSAETTYYVRVKADYGDGIYSNWSKSVSFTTDITCPVPTDLALANITHNRATASWNGGAESYQVMIGEEKIVEATFGFEDGKIPASFINDANNPWTTVSSEHHSGSYCATNKIFAISGLISDLTCEVTGPGTVCFYAKISSEKNCDFGYFLIDGTEKFKISGSTDWTSYSYDLTAGKHTLVWRYAKDGYTNVGDDRFYVDDITIATLGASSWSEYTATGQSYTFSGLTPETSYQVKVKGYYGSDGYSDETLPVRFTTLANDGTPDELSTTDIYANTATLNWAGAQNSYNVRYRIPFSAIYEGFEDEDELAKWTVISNNTENSEKLGRIGDAKKSGFYGFRFSSYHFASDYNQYLISPKVSGVQSVDFWYKSSSAFTEFFRVGYSTTGNDVSDFIWGNEIKSKSDSEWTHFEDNDVPEGVRYVAINYYSRSYNYLYVDDITIKCGSADEWVNKSGVTSPLTITGLVQETNYEWQVQGIYNESLTDWSDMATFTTQPPLILADIADNSAQIAALHRQETTVILRGRTLYKDGDWNTLTLPFNVTLEGSALAGADVRSLSTASIDGTTLNLTFTAENAVTTLVAGTPYIIKWAKADGYDQDSEDTRDIKNPVFTGVTIDVTDRSFTSGSGDTQVRFLGTYKSTTFNGEDKSILFLGADNKLYYPQSGASIGAQRAYFKIGDGAAPARLLTAFDIDFGEDMAGISTMRFVEDPLTAKGGNYTNSNVWFTLDGVRLDGPPMKKGLYIHNGKKVVIK